MATAIKVRQEDYELELTLNRREAEALRALLNRVGGHPDTTRRGLVSGVASALQGAGVYLFDADIKREAGIDFEEQNEQR